MEKDKNTQDLEKFVREQMESIQPKPDADTWSKIAKRQQPLNTWLRLRFYGIRCAVLLGTIAAIWAVWQYYSPETPVTPPPVATSGQQNIVENTSAPGLDPFSAAAIPPAASDQPLTSRISGQKRPEWYHHNMVPMQQVRFSAEKGIQYRSPISGNKVRIPGGVLVYADGSPVTGAVDLLFREYRTMADFLAAGMPMHYEDERGAFFFNSGGMFEVRVSQNGADLRMAPGKTYQIDFAPTADLRDATLYYLPDDTNQWGHVPHGQQALEDTVGLNALLRPRVLTENQVAADNRSNMNLDCLPGLWPIPDTADAVSWLQGAIQTGRAYAAGAIQPPVWFRKNAERGDAFFLRALDRSDIRIVHRYDTEERFFPDDLNKVFSELSAFKECYFTRLIDSSDMLWRPDPQNSVDQMFRQQRNWTKVNVYPQGGANCTVVFGDEDEEIKVPARLSRSSERGNNAPFNPALIFTEYERLRAARHQKTIDGIQRWRHFVATADMFQTAEEWCMPMRMWFDYFDENKKMMQQRYDALHSTGLTTDRALAAATIEKWKERIRGLHFDRIAQESKNQSKTTQMVMSLSVSGFGTYNWDQIFQVADQDKYLYPRYQTLGGDRIIPASTRVIDREQRLFFSLPKNDQLIKAPGRLLDIVITAKDGRIFLLPGKTYAGLAFEGKEEFTFQMEDVTDKVGTPLEWARLLQI